MPELPSEYHPDDMERRWQDAWEKSGIHRWDPQRPRSATFVVDTPPPTVSGSLHIGHVFSYTHQDVLVRFHRMRGFNICYPMGWDDNGLPTERRVQNVFRIRCNPTLPYQREWRPNRQKTKDAPIEEVSRRNFIDACSEVTLEDEKAFEALWRHLGLSVDWSMTYATIDRQCRRTSQASFLELLEKKQLYQTTSPTMWDLDFQTAVAQAEVEERVRPGAYHDIRFELDGGASFVISTTRPELLPACIAVVAHPHDARYQSYFGKNAVSPLFHAPVPVMPWPQADPEKGTGIMMVCTFGDQADVEFWKHSPLPLKQLIGTDGRLLHVRYGEGAFLSRNADEANRAYEQLADSTIAAARKRIVELLRAADALVGEPRPVEHPVKFYERGERPVEYLPTRQWYVHLLEHKQELLKQGHKIQWHPHGMRVRYETWVQGLNQDWCISRQRFFGVPIPVWYRISPNGNIQYDHPILPERASLPVDPMSQPPPGYQERQRNQDGGFCADPDVLDTWATSSLTPQIVSGWPDHDDRHSKLFPMDLRPQSHEIIRTWAFYTIVKAWMHNEDIPWRHVAISGWILDPDRKKMSKSVGNVVTPDHLLKQHSSDAVRYWAARARLGVDTAFDEHVFKIGSRLCTKLFHVSRFVLQHTTSQDASTSEVTESLDLAWVDTLRQVVEQATTHFKAFEYPSALSETEEAFWTFCDDYVELVKRRVVQAGGGPGRGSAAAALRLSLRTFVQLFAPTLPFITEEIWSWGFQGAGRDASVHTSHWPSAELLDTEEATDALVLSHATEVLHKIRMAKTNGKVNLRWPVKHLAIVGNDVDLALLRLVLPDVLVAGAVQNDCVRLVEGTPPKKEYFGVTVTLGDEATV
ncbi:MAG TPA: valine--tRNA ligase [Candidatus Xenobia bacterium]|jgi:valyl-tRNA synthetase